MIIIGERINTSRKHIAAAVRKKDSEFIKSEAKGQAQAGANFIDINCGTNVNTEIEDMKWLAATVQSAVDLPLCIDSPSSKVIEAVLPMHKGRAFINSVTAEKARAEAVFPLVKKYNCFVVGLAMGASGVPSTAEERKEAAMQIMELAKKFNIDKDSIYIDAVVQPVSTDSQQAMEFLKGLRAIKYELGLKTIAGLSNVSFGLPKRTLLNASFLAMSVTCGLDAAIVDVTDPNIYGAIKAGNLLFGRDQFCQEYIRAFRDKKLP